MNRLHFKLISNQETLIDTITNYIKSNNNLKFKVNNDLYEYHLEKLTLIKKSKDSKITIDFKNKIIKIKLHNISDEFIMDISDIFIENNEDIIKLEYSFYNDEKTTNYIIIEYV